MVRPMVRAKCSHVQASWIWYDSKLDNEVATGPERPDGRNRISTSYKDPYRVGAVIAVIKACVRREK